GPFPKGASFVLATEIAGGSVMMISVVQMPPEALAPTVRQENTAIHSVTCCISSLNFRIHSIFGQLRLFLSPAAAKQLISGFNEKVGHFSVRRSKNWMAGRFCSHSKHASEKTRPFCCLREHSGKCD
ncbi:hypothetical protein, partial [Roseovarius nanhaiticus]|uniref:hypothetical protein n=1 Tax=Roseovarius nanhaiticus TaxID=573024 RepID=UPI001BB03E7B